MISDTELQRLAASPTDRVLPALDRADGAWPLVVVLGFVPPLASLLSWSLDTVDAAWGLRAIATFESTSLGGWLDAGLRDASVPYRWLPPLQTWLTAAIWRAIGPSWPLVLILPTAVSCGLLIWSVYRIIDLMSGSRVAVLSVLVFCLHFPYLAASRNAAPVLLSLALGTCAVWAFVQHLLKSDGVASQYSFFSGLALALTMLSGGPFALLVVLSFPAAIFAMQAPRLDREANSPDPWTAAGSIAVITLTAFALGGWWFLMMAGSGGWALLTSAFQSGTCDPILSKARLTNAPGLVAAVITLFNDFGLMLFGLAGLSLVGATRLVRVAIENRPETEADWYGRLLGITGPFVAVGWLGMRILLPQDCLMAEQIKMLMLLYLVALAGWGVAEISARRVAVPVLFVAVIVCLLAVRLPASDSAETSMSSSVFPWLSVSFTVCLLIAVWWFRRPQHRADERRRVVLVLLTSIPLAANLGVSIRGMKVSADPLIRSITQHRSMAACDLGLLVADEDPPLPLVFMLRLQTPYVFAVPGRQQAEMLTALAGRSLPSAVPRLISGSSDRSEIDLRITHAERLLIAEWGYSPDTLDWIAKSNWDVEGIGEGILYQQQPWRMITVVRPLDRSQDDPPANRQP